jgi:DnaJ like chaperone protein
MSVWDVVARFVEAVSGAVSGAVSAMWNAMAGDPAATFSMAVVALSAKMAKADGVVVKVEIETFERIFAISDHDRPIVERLFNLAATDTAGYEAYARQIARLFEAEPHMLEDVLDTLYVIAAADGAVHEAESAFITEVARIFGIDKSAMRRIAARHAAPGKDDPFAILGLTPAASDDDVKRRWRALARENHPDGMIARGVPTDFIKVATERLARINGAYEHIARERGL